MTPRVGIVGAGSAGLAAAQACAARGLRFTVFEAGSGVGGNWRVPNDSGHASGYESLRANTSRHHTRYRAFGWPGGTSMFPRHTEVLRYLEAYTDHFGLRPRIRFNAPVQRATHDAGEGWTVATPVGTESVDHLVVATGYNSVPVTPAVPGRFTGLVLHSHDYRSPEPFRDLDVVVVGLGCSAVELAHELTTVARSVTVSARSASWIMARRLGPLPVDWLDTRSGSLLPWSVRRRMFRPLIERAGGSQTRAGLPAASGRTGDRPLAVSDHFIAAVRRGEIAVAPGLAGFDGRRVRFADGREQAADAVLLATGYDAAYPFLPDHVSPPSVEDAPLYRGITHLDLPTLHFVGLVFGHGALIPLFEAQANWVGEVVTGRLRLPSADAMRASVEADRKVRARRFDPRYGIIVDRQSYVRHLDREVRHAARHPGTSPRAALATT